MGLLGKKVVEAFPGESPAARHIARVVPRLASSSTTVLLLGESGTGKSFLARSLHASGCRAEHPFRVVNCAAIPETLIESELFGHERGAYTGAVGTRVGTFESAGEGTIFLDEIAELPLASQAKLLRALEERRFERVGSNEPRALAARVIAATNCDLAEMVAAG
jgi:two-component system nitrogen regulation response regulator GlnG